MKKLLILLPILFLWFPNVSHAAGIRVASGTYTGTGSTQVVSVTPSFAIKFVIVKAVSAEATSDGADGSTDTMSGNAFNMWQNNNLLTTSITAVGTGQFTVYGGNLQNHSGTTYSYIAIGGDTSSFYTSSFIGNGSSQTITAPGFLPTGVVFTKSNTNTASAANFGTGGADSSEFWVIAQANLTNRITGFVSTGFSVGSQKEANENGSTMYYATYPSISGHATSGSYTGNGSSQSITGLGFQPDVVIVIGSTAAAIMKSSNGTTSTNSLPFESNTAQITTGITSLDSDGFSVGSNTHANNNGTSYHYMAFKDTTTTSAPTLFPRIFSWW